MDHRLAVGIGPFVLLVIASCGSSSSSSSGDSNPTGPGNGSDASDIDGSAAGDDMAGVDGSASSGGGGPDGSGAIESDSGTATSSADVPQMHKHINRDGLFVDSAFTKSGLMGATMHIDTTFAGTVSGKAYASPIYVSNGVGGKGTFYVATENNNLYALDEATGQNAITPPYNAGAEPSQSGAGCGNIKPLGITGTPAIDPATRIIVFDATTAASGGNAIKTHIIHALSIDDFTEKWHLDVSTLTDATAGAFMPVAENQRSAVLIVGGVAYVSYGGHWGDCGNYHGWLVGVPLTATPATVATLAKAYATPAAEAGMWACGGPSSDGTSIFAATGNSPDTDKTGTLSAWKGAYSVLRFAPGPVFTPGSANFWHAIKDDSGNDEDLGGSAPLVVDNPAITPPALVVQLGKDGYAYTLNRANLGGEASPVGNLHVMNGEISNAAAWATASGSTYVAMVSNGGATGDNCVKGSGSLVVAKLSATAQITVPWCVDNQGGGSPSITSSDGTNDMLVWTVGTEGSGQLHAWDLETGDPVVAGSQAMSNLHHFTTPIFVHGRVFVAADNRLYALKQ